MMLSDIDLKEMVRKHQLITPFLEENCEGATINLTLSNKIKKYISSETIVLGKKVEDKDYKEIDISEEKFQIEPGQSVIVKSNEYFKIPKNMGSLILERYSLKLLGLVISPASYMNPGYEGTMSFIANNTNSVPIQLTSGVKFCQLAVFQLSSESEKPYDKQSGKYMNTSDVSVSKLHLDEEIQQFMKKEGVSYLSDETARELGKHLMSHIKGASREIADIIREKNTEDS